MVGRDSFRAAMQEASLPREMQEHTYEIMRRVEDAHWWFAGRRRLIETAVERALDKMPPTGEPRKILDVGCGTGANLELLAKYGDCEGVDVSDAALAFCRDRGLSRVHKGAAEALPFDDGRFDMVTALDVVEHLDDDVKGLSEMRRVLRPGGYAVLFVPAFMFLWGVQDDVSHHRRRYTLPALRASLTRAGLTPAWDSYANLTFFAPILMGRALMRVTGLKPASENNINVDALNGLFGRVLGAERHVLRRSRLPLGVSAVAIARRDA